MFSVRIKRHQVGLRFRYGDLSDILRPGRYRFWSRLWSAERDTVLIADRLETEFEHPQLDALLALDALRDELIVVDLAQHERALVWRDGRLYRLLGAGRTAFWKGPAQVEVETFDANAFQFEHPALASIMRCSGASRFLRGVTVGATERVIAYRDGAFFAELGPGVHAFWLGAGELTWNDAELREQTLDVAGQEIMTRDKVSLRINLVVTFRITDHRRALEQTSDARQALYRDAQLALRTAIGTRTLDELLADKISVGDELRDALGARAATYGIGVVTVGLRDLILPGEMKTILNQVIEAEKQAQANLIRRREETAAARSQANTARLLAENPALARMKELEALQGILSNVNATFVLGQGDLVNQVSGLISTQETQ